MMNVSLVGDKQLMARLSAMPDRMQKSLTRAVFQLALDLENYVKRQKLSGQVLNHRSGRLWRSIHNSVKSNAGEVSGRVYSSGDVKYAAIHEYGGVIPPHVIEPRRARALSFAIGGKQVFATKVNHPGAVMPERSFMRSSLRDNRAKIEQRMIEAVMQGVQQG